LRKKKKNIYYDWGEKVQKKHLGGGGGWVPAPLKKKKKKKLIRNITTLCWTGRKIDLVWKGKNEVEPIMTGGSKKLKAENAIV